MARNVGKVDRVLRAVAAVGLGVCAVVAPVDGWVRGLMVAQGLYFLGTSLAGSCLGYRLMGKSTCPVPSRT
ncbi:DUF2892 domain-containing protein [Pyxidicoccus parkwayensis]|uniref:DUF2892 domain-containing protein n=1 Tax=Pyxidicoccus parkwayensis TaxID=2813578 RepID=A0ABX7NWW4_9BACT|nr:DUF2892 domain-containing protein [Pyxidicoccus parkwaysis]QSQ22926.1 DUF2892 domain-containing protein [Pyxidicoccus parkwaysis]